jgi:flagellar biosynthesis/type III secretory pathway protein FliH|tara:strand:+ start:8594 stop:8965 length:372 start_codon:yes stop_codon:yes gene_type:complete
MNNDIWDTTMPVIQKRKERPLPTTQEELDSLLDTVRDELKDEIEEEVREDLSEAMSEESYDNGYGDGRDRGSEDEYERWRSCVNEIYCNWEERAEGNMLSSDREKMRKELWLLIQDLASGGLP